MLLSERIRQQDYYTTLYHSTPVKRISRLNTLSHAGPLHFHSFFAAHRQGTPVGQCNPCNVVSWDILRAVSCFETPTTYNTKHLQEGTVQ